MRCHQKRKRFGIFAFGIGIIGLLVCFGLTRTAEHMQIPNTFEAGAMGWGENMNGSAVTNSTFVCRSTSVCLSRIRRVYSMPDVITVSIELMDTGSGMQSFFTIQKEIYISLSLLILLCTMCFAIGGIVIIYSEY